MSYADKGAEIIKRAASKRGTRCLVRDLRLRKACQKVGIKQETGGIGGNPFGSMF
jgi:hypothetical protein